MANRHTAIPLTESINPRSQYLDKFSSEKIVSLLCDEERKALRAVRECTPHIADAAKRIARCIERGGRLIYVGAGTSGRIGVQDAAECVPTFGIPTEQVAAILAGGDAALVRSVEGAEDNERAAREALRALSINERDIVCGIAASGTTPFVLGALTYARQCGAETIFVTCATASDDAADVVIALQTGPEVIAGSTRLKAGTATKMVLNALTTTTFILLGKTYGGLMVDLQPMNDKLRRRAIHIVAELTGRGTEEATSLIESAHWSIKTALVMHFRHVDKGRAAALLEEHRGFLRPLIGDVGAHLYERDSASS